jgi:hypothetical protein
MYYDPDDDKEVSRFKFELKSLPNKYDPYNLTWNITRLQAFQNVLRGYILNKIRDGKVTYVQIEQNDRSYDLRITVESIAYGKLSTEVPIGMIMHKDCPPNLPQLIATEFRNNLIN